MTMKRFVALLLAVCCLVPSLVIASDGGPLPLIQSRDQEIRAYIGKRTLPLSAKDKEPLKQLLNDLFDYDRIALDALGARNQKLASKKELDEFLSLFRQVTVNNSVSDKALEYYSEGRIQYRKPEEVGRRTVVSAKITYKGEEIRLDYYFEKNPKGEWRITDYSVDDASLVDTYRVSFSKIIKDNGFGELLRRLRNRLESPDDTKLGGATKL